MSHYFKNDITKSNPKTINIKIKDLELEFATDAGVFSKDEIDLGTKFLIETIFEEKDLLGDALDLGCGIGVIGIFLKKKFPNLNFVFSDVNERAVKLTGENCKKHGVTSEIIISDCFENINITNFSLIISNPPFRAGNMILFKMFEESFMHLKSGGKFIIVLRKKQGGETYIKKLESIFGNSNILDKHKGYIVVEFVKP